LKSRRTRSAFRDPLRGGGHRLRSHQNAIEQVARMSAAISGINHNPGMSLRSSGLRFLKCTARRAVPACPKITILENMPLFPGSRVDHLTDAGHPWCSKLYRCVPVWGVAMGQKLQPSRAKQKVRRGSPNLPKMVAELHKLRHRIRVAEAALQSKTARPRNLAC